MLKTISIFLIFFTNSSYSMKLEQVLEGQGIIWGMQFINSDILFTEREGQIKRFNLKSKKITVITGGPITYSKGQGGLLDIKLHPNFSKNKRIYLSYSKKIGRNKTTALGYGIYEKNKLLNFKDIFVAKGFADTRHHFGSRITFNKDSHIFLSIGDRGGRENAQDLKNHFGTIVRITDEGKTVSDNPFTGGKRGLAEIWSYGHRNSQGLFFDKVSNNLYEMEHGPRGGDEINIIKKSGNYGWPIVSHGKEYDKPSMVGEATKKIGMEDPIKVYIPSIAPSDFVIYRGNRYPKLKNSFLSGALKEKHLNVVKVKTLKETRFFENKNHRVRSIGISPGDFIYLSTDAGKIFKINP